MLKTRIVDGNGTDKQASVLATGELLVSTYQSPPLLSQKTKIFSQDFTDDGTATGSNDLGIDGSGTAVDFYIPASETNDIYITKITFIFGYGASAEAFEFADSGAQVTNGVKISYLDTNSVETVIANPKANYGFMQLSGQPISTTNWEARGFAATGDYGYFVNIFIKDLMPPYGVKLDRGTQQRMTITIRDDCSDADLFNCWAIGFERFE